MRPFAKTQSFKEERRVSNQKEYREQMCRFLISRMAAATQNSLILIQTMFLGF